jgi:acyl transferase domain-containing protein
MHPARQLAVSGAASTAALVVLAAAARSPAAQLGTGAVQYDPVGLVPLERWNLEADLLTSTSARFGAFLPDVANFDATLLGVSPTDASLMDPQQRLLLETATEVLLLASGTSNSSNSTRAVSFQQQPWWGGVGAYIGIASSDYGSLVKACAPAGAFHATANAVSVAAGRLSFSFGLSGPALSVDTACSASLVALHLAKDAVHASAASSSLVGGVHVQATQTSTSYVWAAGMLSPSGRCQVLDAAADGYVRGEACHMLLLAPAAHAANTKGPLALVLGSAVNQDGRSSSLTAPNGPAQQAVLRAALADAGVAADGMDQLSMHGTGTPLGE